MKTIAMTVFGAVALTFTLCPPAVAAQPTGSCAGGDFRWAAVDGGITLVPHQFTYLSTGVLRGCVGMPDIIGGTFTGRHVAVSDCLHPAAGPLEETITWSNGETSTARGDWFVPMSGHADGLLDVVAGLGAGSRVHIVADYDMGDAASCFGAGISGGDGRIDVATVE
jgi:hypothetical protein